jgi:hypothetical protein
MTILLIFVAERFQYVAVRDEIYSVTDGEWPRELFGIVDCHPDVHVPEVDPVVTLLCASRHYAGGRIVTKNNKNPRQHQVNVSWGRG